MSIRLFKIIPLSSYNKLISEHHQLYSLTSDPLIESVLKLKGRINEIQQNQHRLSEEEIRDRYSSAAKRLIVLITGMGNKIGNSTHGVQPPAPVAMVQQQQQGGGVQQSQLPNFTNKFIQQLPDKKQKRGAHILQAILGGGENIYYDDITNSLSVNGQRLHGLNLVDAIQDMLAGEPPVVLGKKRRRPKQISNNMLILLRELARSSPLGARTIANPALRSVFEQFRKEELPVDLPNPRKKKAAAAVTSKWLKLCKSFALSLCVSYMFVCLFIELTGYHIISMFLSSLNIPSRRTPIYRLLNTCPHFANLGMLLVLRSML